MARHSKRKPMREVFRQTNERIRQKEIEDLPASSGGGATHHITRQTNTGNALIKDPSDSTSQWFRLDGTGTAVELESAGWTDIDPDSWGLGSIGLVPPEPGVYAFGFSAYVGSGKGNLEVNAVVLEDPAGGGSQPGIFTVFQGYYNNSTGVMGVSCPGFPFGVPTDAFSDASRNYAMGINVYVPGGATITPSSWHPWFTATELVSLA